MYGRKRVPDVSRILRLGSVDGNATAERIQDFHSGGWFQIFAFSSPKNAVTVYCKRKAELAEDVRSFQKQGDYKTKISVEFAVCCLALMFPLN